MQTGLRVSTDTFLNGLAQISRRFERAQNELTSGKKLVNVSDDPTQVTDLLQFRSELGTIQDTASNLGYLKTETDAGEAAISNAVTLVEKARTLAAQGATGTQSADNRSAIAGQLTDILTQLVSVANTSVGGRYLFSGDSDQAPAYSIDPAQSVPVSVFQGTPSTRQAVDETGSAFATSKTAQDLFDSPNPAQNVFSAINGIRLALLSNDQTQINGALSAVDSAGTYLNAQHAFYGSVQAHVDSSIQNSHASAVRIQAEISGVEDADLTQAALDLSNASLAHNTAIESMSKAPRNSLFDYLG